MTFEYALVLFCIVIGPLAMSRDKKLALAAHPWALAKSIAIVCTVFWIWDVAATAREHWWFNDAYVLGPRVLGMPVEEWIFFVVLSFVSIFAWESTKYFLKRRR